jgi:hypothetical protein
MTIAAACPSCRAEFEVPERLVGKRIRCKTCREEFRVKGSGKSNDYDDEPRPPRRPKARSPVVPLAIVGGILGVCLVIAVVIVWLIPQPKSGPENDPVLKRAREMDLEKLRVKAPRDAVLARHLVFHVEAEEQRRGRMQQPKEGPAIATLSNLRPVTGVFPRPTHVPG